MPQEGGKRLGKVWAPGWGFGGAPTWGFFWGPGPGV